MFFLYTDGNFLDSLSKTRRLNFIKPLTRLIPEALEQDGLQFPISCDVNIQKQVLKVHKPFESLGEVVCQIKRRSLVHICQLQLLPEAFSEQR